MWKLLCSGNMSNDTTINDDNEKEDTEFINMDLNDSFVGMPLEFDFFGIAVELEDEEKTDSETVAMVTDSRATTEAKTRIRLEHDSVVAIQAIWKSYLSEKKES